MRKIIIAVLAAMAATTGNAQNVDITNALYPERYPAEEQAALRGASLEPQDTTHNAGDDIVITSPFVLKYMHDRDSVAAAQDNTGMSAMTGTAAAVKPVIPKVVPRAPRNRLMEDPERAKICRAAENGDMEAQYQLGLIYDLGKGITRDAAEATYWYRRAARNGHPEALLAIGKAFLNGDGVLQDDRIAAENFWRAAERGNPEGAYQFATMLKNGQGVAQDLPRALKYFTQAAEANYEDAGEQVSALVAKGVRLKVRQSPARSKTTATRSASKSKYKKSVGERPH